MVKSLDCMPRIIALGLYRRLNLYCMTLLTYVAEDQLSERFLPPSFYCCDHILEPKKSVWCNNKGALSLPLKVGLLTRSATYISS
jgi:hypothetical protein